MPNIDDHMDDLLRRAADNYPLKTDTGNFEDLLPFVAGQAAVTVAGKASTGKRKSWVLLLACLIIGGSTLTYFIYNNNTGNSITTSASPQKNKGEQKAVPSQTNNSSQLNTATQIPATDITTANETQNSDNFYQPNKQKQNTGARFSINIIGSTAMGVVDEEEKLTSSKDLTAKTKTVYNDHQQTKITVVNPGTVTDGQEENMGAQAIEYQPFDVASRDTPSLAMIGSHPSYERCRNVVPIAAALFDRVRRRHSLPFAVQNQPG